MSANTDRAEAMGCSAELVAGIRRYEARIAALGGYGTPIVARRPNGERLEGTLIERGFGGCQPGLLTADGRRHSILLDPSTWGSDWPVLEGVR